MATLVARCTGPTKITGFYLGLVLFLISTRSHADKELVLIRPISNHRIQKSDAQVPTKIITLSSQTLARDRSDPELES